MAEVKGLTYVPQIYEDIFECVHLDHTKKALEIGIGMGQATRPILDTGCSLTAVEQDEKMVLLCKETFADVSAFSVVQTKFEDFEGEENSFDLVYSASAFHEVDQAVGYTKAFALLKSGGVFVRLSRTNRLLIASVDVADRVDYRRDVSELFNQRLVEHKAQ